MKQFWAVLSLCLSLLGSTAFAPFVHLHADAAHQTGHHDGRVVHSHAAAHVPAAPHHHDHDTDIAGANLQDSSEERAALAAASRDMALAPGGVVGGVQAPATRGAPAAVVEPFSNVTERPRPAASPPADVGVDPPNQLDRTPSSLRGPPR